jgi:hypothetical protein
VTRPILGLLETSFCEEPLFENAPTKLSLQYAVVRLSIDPDTGLDASPCNWPSAPVVCVGAVLPIHATVVLSMRPAAVPAQKQPPQTRHVRAHERRKVRISFEFLILHNDFNMFA